MDDDDDDDLEEEDDEEEEMKSALRRDVDALLSRIEGLNNAKGDALMTDGQLKMELESIERERERMSALLLLMMNRKKKKKKKKKSETPRTERRLKTDRSKKSSVFKNI